VLACAGLDRGSWGHCPSHVDDPFTATADTMDNAVFIIDLPLLAAQSPLREQESIPFRVELLKYLKDCLEVDEDIYRTVQEYDFIGCKPYGFFYTGYVGSAELLVYALTIA
jgi:hypothetical protein